MANFGFIKPAAAAGGGGGSSGNIFVHKSNIKFAAGVSELSAGQLVKYRLAPHEAPATSPATPRGAGVCVCVCVCVCVYVCV